jgi:hypothetical protein
MTVVLIKILSRYCCAYDLLIEVETCFLMMEIGVYYKADIIISLNVTCSRHDTVNLISAFLFQLVEGSKYLVAVRTHSMDRSESLVDKHT